MTTTAVAARPNEVGRVFYLVMFLIMVAILVAGFSKTVPGDFTSTPGLPLLLHVHGAVLTCWVAIMVAQPSLIVAGNVRRHIQLGVIGAFLAVAAAVMAVLATLFSIGHNMVPPFFPKPIFLALNLLQIVTFVSLFSAAFALRRQVEWHKRLMFCACAAILGPGLGRLLPMMQFGPQTAWLALFAVNNLVLLAGPAADLMIRKKLHPAYIWGVGAMAAMEAAVGILGSMPMTEHAVHALGG